MKYEKLDTTSFETLFQKAVEQWKVKSGNQEVYPSDVSYTLIEMMVMLEDMLNYYMEHISETHTLRYASLLACRQPEKKCFPVQLVSEHEQYMRAGYPFFVSWQQEEITLELMHDTFSYCGNIVGMYYKDQHQLQRLDGILQQEAGCFAFPEQSEDAQLYILLDHPFVQGEPYAVYVDCDSSFRGPKQGKKPAFAKWELSCYGEKGWQRVEIEEDETWDFLYSGILRFRIPFPMKMIQYEYRSSYVLRFSCRKQCYDTLPVIASIYMSSAMVRPQRHWSRCFCAAVTKQEPWFDIKEDISSFSQLLVLKEDHLQKGYFHEMRFHREDRSRSTRIIVEQQEDQILYVYAVQKHPFEQQCTGAVMQRILLPACELSGLMVQEAHGYRYYPCETESEKKTYDYGVKMEDGVLQFGSGRDFRPPKQAGSILYENLIAHYDGKLQDVQKEQQLETKTHISLRFLHSVQKEAAIHDHTLSIPPCDTICSREDLYRALKKIPGLALHHIRICGRDAHFGWHIYIETKTGHHPDWYLKHIEEHLSSDLLFGLQVKIDWFHKIRVRIHISCSASMIRQQQLKALIAAYVEEEKTREISQKHIEELCARCLGASARINITLWIEDKQQSDWYLQEDEMAKLEELQFLPL